METKHKNKYFTCKRLRLLEYLMNKGFTPITDVPDPHNWKYRHWIFANTVELEDAIDEYFDKILQKNQ